MARGINKVILLGNIGADPEVRYLPNGNAVATLSIATGEVWKDKQTGERQERTEWHRVVCFNRLGEIAGEYAKKGAKVYIEGSLKTRKWQDQQGQDKYTTEIIAQDFQMVDDRNSNRSGGPSYEDDQRANTSFSSSKQQEPVTSGSTDLDDDIPF